MGLISNYKKIELSNQETRLFFEIENNSAKPVEFDESKVDIKMGHLIIGELYSNDNSVFYDTPIPAHSKKAVVIRMNYLYTDLNPKIDVILTPKSDAFISTDEKSEYGKLELNDITIK